MKEKEALELGKIWMKNSINKGHDYLHAQHVEEHALVIYKELKKAGKLPAYVDESLVSLSAWWHDSYKARTKGLTLWAYLFEGYESEKIVKRELKGLLTESRLKRLAQAVRMHNHFAIYFLISKNYPPLAQILIEADNIEATSKVRLRRSYESLGVPRPFVKLIYKVYIGVLLFWLKRLPKSKYMEEFLNNFNL
ncbi:MAG TPA: hypothetical protein PLV59_01250 [Candidatus Dojkabacteria bacterium]|nr:hypothetical protein [Candidatus Dojkabacteria bacterium]